MSDGDHCKACGSHHASKGRFCPMCGHSYDCGGCGGCQQCPICGNDRKEDRPPFQTGDLTTYLEMAKFCLDSARVRGRVANELDLSDEEIKRLQKQLEEALNHE